MKMNVYLAAILGVVLFGGFGCGASDAPPNHVPTSDLAQFVAPPEDLARMCVGSCTTDTACQDSCPGVTTGVNCCDVATSMCYVSNTTTCPVPVIPDMAQSQMMY